MVPAGNLHLRKSRRVVSQIPIAQVLGRNVGILDLNPILVVTIFVLQCRNVDGLELADERVVRRQYDTRFERLDMGSSMRVRPNDRVDKKTLNDVESQAEPSLSD